MNETTLHWNHSSAKELDYNKIAWRVDSLDVTPQPSVDPYDPDIIEATVIGSIGTSDRKLSYIKLDRVHDSLNDRLRGGACSRNSSIKKVIFNDPATIILWADGTKTVVKCQQGDTYDCEKGFVMAYLKRLLGDDNTFNKEIKKWVPPVKKDENVITIDTPLFARNAVHDALLKLSEDLKKGIEDGMRI